MQLACQTEDGTLYAVVRNVITNLHSRAIGLLIALVRISILALSQEQKK
jgi:hypothetical protein